MHALVLMGLLALGAKPSKPPVTLPMPPPPAAKPKPADPPPPAEPAPEATRPPAPKPAAPPREAGLLSKLQLGAGIGPGFSLSQGVAPSGSNPVWLRGTVRATLDLLRAGPGELQALVPIAVQGASFKITLLGFVIQGSLFGLDVMPSVRYLAEVLPDLSLFAELGLGFGGFQTTLQQQFVGYQTAGASGFGVRVGAGLEYRVLDQVRILFQPMDVTSFTVTTSVTQAGTTVTSTGSTSEWALVAGLVVPLGGLQ